MHYVVLVPVVGLRRIRWRAARAARNRVLRAPWLSTYAVATAAAAKKKMTKTGGEKERERERLSASIISTQYDGVPRFRSPPNTTFSRSLVRIEFAFSSRMPGGVQAQRFPRVCHSHTHTHIYFFPFSPLLLFLLRKAQSCEPVRSILTLSPLSSTRARH